MKRLCTIALGLAIAICCLLQSRMSLAQSITTGEITGTVADSSGAVVPNATITLKSIEKGFTQTLTSGAAGGYRISLLPPGTYNLSVSATGFKTAVETSSVSVGAVSTVNIKLDVGAEGTTVEVSGEAAMLQTDSSEISTTMNTLAVESLPNPGNDLSYIAQTAPGSVMNTQAGTGNFSSFGISATSNLFTMNGMYDNDPFLNVNNSGATNLTLGNNEIQEATVVSNGYSGQYGSFAGAQVNYVTKSGSNQWHGNANYWWNGSALNANDWFNNNTTPKTPKQFDNANQWAAAFGGPIKKDKAFFFFNYEGLRVIIPVSNLVTLPSAGFQAATLANLPNFFSGNDLNTETAFYKNMFNLYNSAPGVSRATPVSAGNGACGSLAIAGVANCADSFVANNGQLTHEYLLAGRFDFNLTNSDKLFVRLQEDKGVQATFTDPISPLFNVTSNQPEYQSQVSWTHTLGAKAVNNLVASTTYYSAIFENSNQASTLAAFPASLLIAGAPFSNSANAIAGTLGGENFAFPEGRNVTQYQFVDDFSYNLSAKHTLKLGENFHRHDISDHDLASFAVPIEQVNSLQSFYDGGAVVNGQGGTVLIKAYPVSNDYPISIYGLGWYVQDEWRVTPTLKITADMRFDHPSNPVCQTNCFGRFAAPFDVLDHSSSIPYNQGLIPNQNQAFQSYTAIAYQPRVGFAWSPRGLKNTVIRGGYGLFSDTVPGVVSDALIGNPPFYNKFVVGGSAVAPGVTGSPYTAADAAQAAFVAGFNSGGTQPVVGVTPNVASANNMKVPMYNEYNLEVQQGIGNNTTININFVGNHGYHETANDNVINGFCPPSACPNGFAGLPSTAPDQRWGSVQQYYSIANSNYNGVTTSVQHRFSQGLQLSGNFTWSHALDEISNGGFVNFNGATDASLANPLLPGPAQISRNYGNADYDTRKYASISYVYQVPYKWGPKPVFQGWQLSGTMFTRSGLPYTVVDGASFASLSSNGYGAAGGTPQIYAGYSGAPQPNCGAGAASATLGGATSLCLNGSDFIPAVNSLTLGNGTVQAPSFSFGDQRRNQFFGPRYFNTDFTVIKYFGIPHWEQGRLGLGAQFFNVLNHTNFDDPVRDIANVSQFGQIVRDVATPTSILGSFLGANASPRLIQLSAKINF